MPTAAGTVIGTRATGLSTVSLSLGGQEARGRGAEGVPGQREHRHYLAWARERRGTLGRRAKWLGYVIAAILLPLRIGLHLAPLLAAAGVALKEHSHHSRALCHVVILEKKGK